MPTPGDQVNAYETATAAAYPVLLAAAREVQDFPGWLAAVLAAVAAELGSTDALLAGRPGSWEAGHLSNLVHGTVGWDDESLAAYRRT